MVREGSVGLFILLGLAIFGALILWLRGFTIGKRSYNTVIEFPNVAGLQAGASVRYRGVTVGRITDIKPGSNGVDVNVEITSPNVVIPRDGLLIETNQSGLIGETYVEMRPLKPLPPNVQGITPLNSNCNKTLIVCNNSRLQGQVGPSIDELLRSATRVANLYSDPKLYANINAVAQKTAAAADQVTLLSRDISGLTRSAQQELSNLSGSVNSVSRAVNQTAYQAGLTVNKFSNTADQFSNTASKFSNTADRLTNTANQYGQSAQQLTQLLGNVNTLVQRNRSTLEATLVNFNQASRQVVGTVDTLKATLTQVNSTVSQVNSTVGRFNSTKLVNNLEVLSANAATASADAAKAAANLRTFTTGLNTLNTRENLVQLQRTLDSAQAVFENARKITSDLDELTGDPNFRNNVRNLVNGLGKLVSSTQQLEQQVHVANVLAPLSEKINTTLPSQVPVSQPQLTSRPLFSKAVPTPSPATQSVPVSGEKARRTLSPLTENQLKSLLQPSQSPPEEWFVPDDQPETKD